jgi:hypothetical protein
LEKRRRAAAQARETEVQRMIQEKRSRVEAEFAGVRKALEDREVDRREAADERRRLRLEGARRAKEDAAKLMEARTFDVAV